MSSVDPSLQVAAVRDALLELAWDREKDEALADRQARWIAAVAAVARTSPEMEGREAGSVEGSLDALSKVRAQARELADNLRSLEQPAYYALLNADIKAHAEDAEGAERIENFVVALEALAAWTRSAENHVFGPEKRKAGRKGRTEVDVVTEQVASVYFVLTRDQPTRSNARIASDGPEGERQVAASAFTLCLGKIFHALGINASADYATRKLLGGENLEKK